MGIRWSSAAIAIAFAASGAGLPAWGQPPLVRISGSASASDDSQSAACEKARQSIAYREARGRQDEGCSCKSTSDRVLKAKPWLKRHYCTVRYTYLVRESRSVQR
jgi:hypothetical protein